MFLKKIANEYLMPCIFSSYSMLVSFDIKFIKRDEKQRRNGEMGCRDSPTRFRSSLINLI